jgi:hypothetical protein
MADNNYSYWTGWLIDDLGSHTDEVFDKLAEAIDNKQIPMFGNRKIVSSVLVTAGTYSMWWRNDTPCLTVKSQMDGTVEARVLVQDYGKGLWVCVVVQEEEKRNWAKAMAFLAFYRTLSRTVEEVVNTVAEGHVVQAFHETDLHKAVI